jgi:hypothetical protein
MISLWFIFDKMDIGFSDSEDTKKYPFRLLGRVHFSPRKFPYLIPKSL